MIKYRDLSESELAALTEDQIKTIVDYECAVKGIDLLAPNPGEKPNTMLPSADCIAYEVSGITTSDKDHASDILALINSKPRYDLKYSKDYARKCLVEIPEDAWNTISVTTFKVYSKELFDSTKAQADLNLALETKWEEAHEAYKAAKEARETVEEPLRSMVRESISRLDKRAEIKRKFKEYLKISGGDRAMALEFLEKVEVLDSFTGLTEELLEGDI